MNPTSSSRSANSAGDRPRNTSWSNNDETFTAWDDTTLNVVLLQPVTAATKEFPPLSLRPLAPSHGLASTNIADRYTLEKHTSRTPVVQRNLEELVTESESMINSGLQQTKHSTAISAELRLLLENEKKIMDQIMRRCHKFSQLKQENKLKTEEWLDENRKRLTKYDSDLTVLANYPDDLNVQLDEEGMYSQIKQNILLEIIHKTAEVAKDISVQLSIEETIINDVELSLSGLKKHSLVMSRLIAGWTDMLGTYDQNQEQLMDRWLRIKHGLGELRERARAGAAQDVQGPSSTYIQTIVSQYDDRLRRLERACHQLRASYCS